MQATADQHVAACGHRLRLRRAADLGQMRPLRMLHPGGEAGHQFGIGDRIHRNQDQFRILPRRQAVPEGHQFVAPGDAALGGDAESDPDAFRFDRRQAAGPLEYRRIGADDRAIETALPQLFRRFGVAHHDQPALFQRGSDALPHPFGNLFFIKLHEGDAPEGQQPGGAEKRPATAPGAEKHRIEFGIHPDAPDNGGNPLFPGSLQQTDGDGGIIGKPRRAAPDVPVELPDETPERGERVFALESVQGSRPDPEDCGGVFLRRGADGDRSLRHEAAQNADDAAENRLIADVVASQRNSAEKNFQFRHFCSGVIIMLFNSSIS
ncbi:hypothetical protein SDC9_125083 [bioreactor metagenome]|uniref:Uncharacterized protein n=1 Tax=bioreactor metagenome TaxID=1076179 RepID=A0A645CMA0_9ZZZZ